METTEEDTQKIVPTEETPEENREIPEKPADTAAEKLWSEYLVENMDAMAVQTGDETEEENSEEKQLQEGRATICTPLRLWW